MPGQIEPETVARVADLARMELPQDELNNLKSDLEKILQYIDILKEIDLDGVAPTAHPFKESMPVRSDLAQLSSIRDELLDLAPDRAGDAYRVPAIISTDE